MTTPITMGSIMARERKGGASWHPPGSWNIGFPVLGLAVGQALARNLQDTMDRRAKAQPYSYSTFRA